MMLFEHKFRRCNNLSAPFGRANIDVDGRLLLMGPSFDFDTVDGPGLSLANHLGSPSGVELSY
ncbi:hypothetical protein [Caballeronia sp. TF1N1]|uniref:hypothetical protein n=1 Tax=Caballeronia sp. TF1N1 TaxID=2878153 RepID=UPI001FCF978F|nr:hypothetical protein [Caballeronia sp. TF1N1]